MVVLLRLAAKKLDPSQSASPSKSYLQYTPAVQGRLKQPEHEAAAARAASGVAERLGHGKYGATFIDAALVHDRLQVRSELQAWLCCCLHAPQLSRHESSMQCASCRHCAAHRHHLGQIADYPFTKSSIHVQPKCVHMASCMPTWHVPASRHLPAQEIEPWMQRVRAEIQPEWDAEEHELPRRAVKLLLDTKRRAVEARLGVPVYSCVGWQRGVDCRDPRLVQPPAAGRGEGSSACNAMLVAASTGGAA